MEYPGLGYPGLGYPELGYPGLGYQELGYPGLGYPELGYQELGYPELGCPGLGYRPRSSGTRWGTSPPGSRSSPRSMLTASRWAPQPTRLPRCRLTRRWSSSASIWAA